MIRYKIVVRGRVQGVGFRYFTYNEANLLNIKGYVRNLVDGSVEIDAEGENENIKMFLESISKGPSYSNVKDIVKEQCNVYGYNDFKLKY